MENQSDQVFHFSEKESFAVYSLPGNEDHFLVFSKDKSFQRKWPKSESGFAVAPFQKEDDDRFWIPADNIVLNGRFKFRPSTHCSLESTKKDDYLKGASDTIESIRGGEYEKVVLSKIKVVENSIEDLYDFFRHLKQSHTKAFVFMYHLAGHGTWCGASPETLVRTDGSEATTMALAATQRDIGLPLDQTEWTEKEIHEQHVIEEFIESRLDARGMSYKKKGPLTVQAADLLHICTEFFMEDSIHIFDLADLLHPGPAICGRPQGKSLQRILEVENHRREDYCGFLGPVNMNKASSLYVNLRSMQIFKDSCALYLGGGLTARSLAEIEWDETELKSNTLLSVMEKSYI